MSATRAALIRRARQLTAEQGLSGFTIEELCEQVGVSRRTFFNYFPSKEDAVIGRPEVGLDERTLLEFAFSPPAGDGLIDELAALAVHFFEIAEFDTTHVQEFRAALDREPRLFSTLMKSAEHEEQRLVEAVAAREGLHLDDPVAAIAVLLVSTLVRRSADQFFAQANDLSFAHLMSINLHAARRVLAPTTAHSHEGTR